MRRLALSLPTTAANLALDEWLLERCDRGEKPGEVIRVWENPRTAVILGRSSRVEQEINRSFCSEHDIPYFRRNSGGASVIIGPGV